MRVVSDCPVCHRPGRPGFDGDWCHEDLDDALACPHEGYCPGDVQAGGS